MSNNLPDQKKQNQEQLNKIAEEHFSENLALDDEQRVKVLSPSMLVFRRFIRNKLAIVGVVFIVLMFLFSFLGGWLMPYRESEVFKKYVDMSKLYAGVTISNEYNYIVNEGRSFPSLARAQFVLALNNNESEFTAQNQHFTIDTKDTDLHVISGLAGVAQAISLKNIFDVEALDDFTLTAEFEKAFAEAVQNKADSFTVDGTDYTITFDRKMYVAYRSEPLALVTYNILDLLDGAVEEDFAFFLAAETAARAGSGAEFDFDGKSFTVILSDDSTEIFLDQELYAVMSPYIVQSLYPDVQITLDFKNTVKEAIAEEQSSFTFADGETEREFSIERDDKQWLIRAVEETFVVNSFEFPSRTHWLGTDGNGMDVMTRLMYGGRVSLMIGFIVVFIEVLIGVVLGGIAGYFGKLLDNLIMRLVDIFNSIPSTPIIIIIGAVMDQLRVDPQIRMIYLMLILGVLGWPGIARLVRGQILSLREQEFMVAAEATGLSVFRRIFKHLVPNVIPQLIVVSTMSLGGIILTESVLSFLGLGVKYPFASWGNIMNAVSNVHVMTSYWFVWIPAGFCVLITVLGFNFIGDGLRDAFDPKMKR
jgi:peptide/nickel transport system permease protein